MLLDAKIWLDQLAYKASRPLEVRKWLYAHLAIKWIALIAILVFVGLWAKTNNSWLLLITPLVCAPIIVKRDLASIRACGESVE